MAGPILVGAETPGHDDGLDGDRRRAETLRRLGPEDENFIAYGLMLRDFGINTLMRQWCAGELRGVVARRTSVVLPQPPAAWRLEHIRSIVGIAVCRSVDPFLESAIVNGGWDAERGTRISTFFVGRCYYAFADDYRREYQGDVDAADTLRADGLDLELDVLAYVRWSVPNAPETTAIERAEIRRLLALATHARIPEIVFLLGTGMPQREIGDRLGTTADAVHNALRKFRADVASTQRRDR